MSRRLSMVGGEDRSVSVKLDGAAAFLVLVAALSSNLVVDDVRWHLGLAVAGLAAMVARRREVARGLTPLVALFVVGALATWLGARAGLDAGALRRTFARSLAGATWSLWFAQGVRWRALREPLLRIGAGTALVELVDGALAQGALLRRELERKRQAAVVRLGWSSFRRRCENGGLLLAGAVVRSLERSDRLGEALAARGAPRAGSASAGPSQDGSAVRLADVHVAGASPGRPRLRGVSLSLDVGAWVVLAGASGAGKSTLLRTIAGIEAPQSGVVTRFGEEVRGAAIEGRVDGRVSLVFQDPDDQFFASDVLGDLRWGLAQRGLNSAAADARALTLLQSMGLGHLADREIATLSFGERKRVAVAVALIAEPALLLCDEPTMGLDQANARLLIDAILAEARRRPMSVVWATHDIEEVPPPASELWLIEDGRLTYRGPLESVAAEEALGALRTGE